MSLNTLCPCKSSEDEDRQLLSIDAQYAELNQIAREKDLTIVGRFDESKSAKEPGREVFNEMLRRIERGEANGILCWALHRIARNFDDGGKVIGLLQREVIKAKPRKHASAESKIAAPASLR